MAGRRWKGMEDERRGGLRRKEGKEGKQKEKIMKFVHVYICSVEMYGEVRKVWLDVNCKFSMRDTWFVVTVYRSCACSGVCMV